MKKTTSTSTTAAKAGSAPVVAASAKAAGTKVTAPRVTAKKASAAPAEGAATKAAAAKPAAKKPAAAERAKPAAKAPAKPAKTAAKAPARKTPPKRGAAGSSPVAARSLRVKADERPWTAKELEEVRSELFEERERLRSELNLAEHELQDLMRDAGDGAGNDQADVGSTTFERDHEMSLANNARDMLTQIEHALGRIHDGSYGVCESCGEPIGKMRLMAFPRATLCLPCKQREERR